MAGATGETGRTGGTGGASRRRAAPVVAVRAVALRAMAVRAAAVLVMLAVVAVVTLGAAGCRAAGQGGGTAGTGGGGAGESGVAADTGAEFPLTVTDARGKELAFDVAPRAIVSLAPSVTEILFVIGAGPQVVGIDDWSNYPPEAQGKARVGSYWPPTVEKVVELQPDLVVAAGEQLDWAGMLEGLGLKVLVVDPQTVDEVEAAITLLGRVTGRAYDTARVVTDIRLRVSAVTSRVAAVPESARPRVFYMLYWDPLMTVGPNSLIGRLIEAAGGRNIAADAASDYPEYSLEALIARDPQVIVIAAGHDPGAPAAADLKGRPGFALLSAVREGRVYAVDPDVMSRPGPRIADALEQLARLFYPELFQ